MDSRFQEIVHKVLPPSYALQNQTCPQSRSIVTGVKLSPSVETIQVKTRNDCHTSGSDSKEVVLDMVVLVSNVPT